MSRLAALALAAVALQAGAAPRRADVAVPYYTPQAYVHGLQAGWLQPRLAEFAQASDALVPAVERVCAGGGRDALPAARRAWAASTQAWERASTVALGPLVERRSARRIDFTPIRPEMIARSIAAAPADLAALERVGSPAKGLPALEHLLWTAPVGAGTPACRYAALLARDVAAEAAALRQAASDTAPPDEDAAAARFAEAINQWIGGLEALRWRHMERPLRSARTGGGGRDAPAFPRAASHETAASWAAQWQALRRLADAAPGAAPPPPGEGLVSLETYLRGRGLNPLADALAHDVAEADARLRGLAPGQAQRIEAAARALGALKRRMEDEVAPALQVSIGFSDADGD